MSHDRLCRWAAWGTDRDALSLDDRARLSAYLREALGGLDPPQQPVPLESIVPPPSRLPADARAALENCLGALNVSLDDRDRLVHSFGRSYRDLIRARQGCTNRVTDAVVYPQSESHVETILEIATQSRLSVVPFGGGTSVVGGVEPDAGEHHAVLTLDTRHLDHVRVDAPSLLADIGAGILGPDLEHRLAAFGLTLGHFPQSFEFSTFGGWIAARGAGQQSTRYGKIERMIQAVSVATPRGWIHTRNVPASAAGPSVLEQIIGSEGTLGVITSAVARVHRPPEATRYQAYLLPAFDAGCALLRELEQAELPLSIVRLSDPEETRWLSRASEGGHSLPARLGKWWIDRATRRRAFSREEMCLAMLSLEGSRPFVERGATHVRAVAARHGAVALGSSPGRQWVADRFRHPYLRDELIARRVMVDTLETATTWSNLRALYDGVRTAISQAISQAGPAGVVMCHLSHLYPSGSSLYFTFLARQLEGGELDQWSRVKQAATAAIVAGNGTLSHHHGIGNEHLPLSAEAGEAAVAALAAAKAALDPAGIMNPSKLFAPATATLHRCRE